MVKLLAVTSIDFDSNGVVIGISIKVDVTHPGMKHANVVDVEFRQCPGVDGIWMVSAYDVRDRFSFPGRITCDLNIGGLS
jgi:hypothetical protein